MHWFALGNGGCSGEKGTENRERLKEGLRETRERTEGEPAFMDPKEQGLRPDFPRPALLHLEKSLLNLVGALCVCFPSKEVIYRHLLKFLSEA